MRGANMNCIAPPMVCMETERGGGGVNDNVEGETGEREREREREMWRRRKGRESITHCWLHVSKAEFKIQDIFHFALKLLSHQINQCTV